MVASKYSNTTPTGAQISQLDDWLEGNFSSWNYKANNGKGTGTEGPELVALAQHLGLVNSAYYAEWTISQLQQELTNGYPVIVRVRPKMEANYKYAHYMVLLWIDNTYVYVNDPGIRNGASVRYNLQDFLDSWNRVAQWNGKNNQVVVIHPNSSVGPKWLSFIEGDPGVPGDGKFVSPGPNTYVIPFPFLVFEPSPAVSFAGMRDGYTLTVFPASGFTWQVLALNPPTGCPLETIGWNTGVSANDGKRVLVNGVEGLAVVYSQVSIQDAVDAVNQTTHQEFPGCKHTFTVDEFSLVYILNGVGGLTTVDAVAFGFGQNNIPH